MADLKNFLEVIVGGTAALYTLSNVADFLYTSKILENLEKTQGKEHAYRFADQCRKPHGNLWDIILLGSILAGKNYVNKYLKQK